MDLDLDLADGHFKDLIVKRKPDHKMETRKRNFYEVVKSCIFFFVLFFFFFFRFCKFCLAKHGGNQASRWTKDLWLKGVSLILA